MKTSFADAEDSNTTSAQPIKIRGVPCTYDPVKSMLYLRALIYITLSIIIAGRGQRWAPSDSVLP